MAPAVRCITPTRTLSCKELQGVLEQSGDMFNLIAVFGANETLPVVDQQCQLAISWVFTQSSCQTVPGAVQAIALLLVQHLEVFDMRTG